MSRQAGQMAGQLASELRRADQWKYSQCGVRSLEKLLLTNLVFGHYSVIIRSLFGQFGIRSLEKMKRLEKLLMTNLVFGH